MPKQKTNFLHESFDVFDRLPPREHNRIKAEQLLCAIGSFYGFEQISTTFFEEPAVVGAVMKAGLLEEYTPIFGKMREGGEFVIRPSAVFSVLRAYSSHKMNDLPHPLKFSFGGESVFLVHKRNIERLRVAIEGGVSGTIAGWPEFGLIMIGEEGPVAEAEIIQVFWKGLQEIGISAEGMNLALGAAGCVECYPTFRSSINSYFRSRLGRLCKNCKRYFKRVPTKIFLCEEEKCRTAANGAPQVLDFLCERCKKHLGGLLEFLDEAKIPYFLNSRFFREGSWFDSFLFEFQLKTPVQSPENNFEKKRIVLAEGGRVSKLGTVLAKKHLDAVSGTINLGTLERVLAKSGIYKDAVGAHRHIFLAHLGELAKRRSLNFLEVLRDNDIDVRESLGRDSIKSQLKVAERVGAGIALILGQKEALDGTIIVREMDSGIQETIPQEKLIEFLKRKLKK